MIMYHSGSNGAIENYTGNLTITNNTNDGDVIFKSDDMQLLSPKPVSYKSKHPSIPVSEKPSAVSIFGLILLNLNLLNSSKLIFTFSQFL